MQLKNWRGSATFLTLKEFAVCTFLYIILAQVSENVPPSPKILQFCCVIAKEKYEFFPNLQLRVAIMETTVLRHWEYESFQAPSNGSQRNHSHFAATLPIAPGASHLLFGQLAAFNDAKRVWCSLVAELDLEMSTIMEEGLRVLKTEPPWYSQCFSHCTPHPKDCVRVEEYPNLWCV